MVAKSSPKRRCPGIVGLVAGAALLAGLFGYRAPTPRSPEATLPNDTASARQRWTGRVADVAPLSAVNVDALAQELIERGRAALADGDFQAGVESYRRALEHTPTAETHGLVGDLYLRAAATSEAAFHLRRAADLEPNNADRWLALANVYILKTDMGAAWKAIERAKEVEPGITVERDRNNFVVRGRTG